MSAITDVKFTNVDLTNPSPGVTHLELDIEGSNPKLASLCAALVADIKADTADKVITADEALGLAADIASVFAPNASVQIRLIMPVVSTIMNNQANTKLNAFRLGLQLTLALMG